MAEQFYTILTNTGKAKIANSLPTGTKVNLTTLKVGDSNGTYYNPSETQTDLVHTVYTCNVTSVAVDTTNGNWINITSVIPSDQGGFTIREVGVFDDGGNLIAIGKYPETYKPTASDGSTKELYLKMTLEVSNSSSVTLKIDPTVILATKSDINTLTTSMNNSISTINAQLSENTQNIEKNANKLTTYDNRNHIGNLDYGLCRIINGLDVTINGSTFTVSSGRYTLNGVKKHSAGNLPIYQADVLLSSTYDIKDPFVLEENGMYYMFYSMFANDSNGDIGYATSTGLETWIDHGLIVNHTNCWGDGSLPVWAPWVSEKQEDGYYYMFVCGATPMATGYLKSESLTSGWVWVDYIRDNNGNALAFIDPSIYKEDNKYYLLLSDDTKINLYTANSLTSNSWTYSKTLLIPESPWEGSLVEAPQFIKLNNNEYAIFYGGSTSSGYDKQHIGLATSNQINGDYTRRGREGMIFLPVPIGGNAIEHPHIMYIESKKEYYLFVDANNSSGKRSIVAYKSKDLIGFEPIKKLTSVPSGTSYVYISPNNDVVMSENLPYNNGQDTTNFDNRIGCIQLGKIVNSSGTLTFTKQRMYEVIAIINAKKTTDALTNTASMVVDNYLSAKLPTHDMLKADGKLVVSSMFNVKNTATVVTVQVTSIGTVISGLGFTTTGVNASLKTYTSNWVEYSGQYVDAIAIKAYCDGTGNYILNEDSSIIFAIEY